MKLTDVVIGSGPTGLAAALGVLQRGGKPTIIDFGTSPSFSAATIDRKANVAMKGDPSRAQVFDYPKSFVISDDGKHVPISSARGGLSTIWGSGILARPRSDMPELDSIYEDLSFSYSRLFELLPAAGAADQTSERFPWPDNTEPAPQSRRYEHLVKAAQNQHSDVLIGFPRLSVDSSGGRCTRCGECLIGCPEKLFLSSDDELRKLTSLGLCTMIDGPVSKMISSQDGVKLCLPGTELVADRVYLAAGPIGSPSLLQRSHLAPNRLEIKDSAVFYTAFLNFNKFSGDETTYTSSHAVSYSRVPGASDFQLALYESNLQYQERLSALAPRLGKVLRIPTPLFKRINAGIGFLDSSISGKLILNYRGNRTWVSRESAKNLQSHARSAIRRTAKVTQPLGVRPLPIVLVPPVGSGYHSGASMPLGGDHVDLNGRLLREPRVRVVDATSLPKIWAGSHTFTAMANAFRIAFGEQ